MRNTVLIFAAAMLSVVGTARAQEVQELADRWTSAYNLYDSPAMGALYHEEAKLFVNGLPTVSGRAAIQEYWTEDMGQDSPMTVLTVTHSVDGIDMKLVHGNYQVLNRLTGVSLGQGRFAHIWTQENGEWLLDRDLWNEPFEPYAAENGQ